MDDLVTAIILIYIGFHSPAIIMIIIGLYKRKSDPEYAGRLFIASAVYFIIGAGICGSMLI